MSRLTMRRRRVREDEVRGRGEGSALTLGHLQTHQPSSFRPRQPQEPQEPWCDGCRSPALVQVQVQVERPTSGTAVPTRESDNDADSSPTRGRGAAATQRARCAELDGK